MRVFSGVVAVCVCVGSAQAALNGFTETFDSDNAGWINFNSTQGADWVSAGGPDGSAYASVNLNLTETGGPFPATFIRANASDGASGGALFGDWAAGGVTGVSFDVRHNLTGRTLEFTSRFATNGFAPNTPGASFDNDNAVASGVWTTVTFDVSEGSPDLLSLGGGTYDQIFSNVLWVQLGLVAPFDLAGQDIDVTLDVDNFRLVPSPGAAGLLAIAGLSVVRRRRG